jgi:CRISPR-associated protein Csm4
MQRDKAVRKVAYIPEAIFQRLRQHMSDGSLRAALMEKASVPEADDDGSETFGLRAHNRIDRLSGTTPESGGLFFEEVFFPSHRSRLQLFVATPNPTLERLEELFHFVGQGGFGRNASTGNGYFACAIAEEHSLFATSGSRAMTLSHGVLTENMLNPRYRQHVHFGKLGGDYAKGDYSPFKYPILMVRPGATFDCRGSGPCGAILKGVHHDPDLFHVRHHALHLPLFFTEAKP